MKLELCTPTNPILVTKMAQQVPLVVHSTQSQLYRKYLVCAEATGQLFPSKTEAATINKKNKIRK